jgi:hypothetical protein
MCRALLYLEQPVLLPEYGALYAEIRNGRPRVALRLLD